MKLRAPGLSARDWGLLAAALALALDQACKFLLLYGVGLASMGPGARVPLLPFFDLEMVWNPGISYGLFPARGTLGTVVLVVLTVIAMGGLGWWLWNTRRLPLATGLGLVIGGALGNLTDRLIYGQVADFFHFYAGTYDWYVFNLADCAITVGVAALLYDALLRPEPKPTHG